MSDYGELDRLLSRYLDGTIAAEELAVIEARLLADDGFADHVSRWCLMNRQITDLGTETALHQLMDDFVKGSSSYLPKNVLSQLENSSQKSRIGLSDTPSSARDPNHDQRKLRSLLIPSVAAAVLVGVTAFAFVYRLGHNEGSTASSVAAANGAANAAADQEFVATITRLVDVVWKSDAAHFEAGERLGSGNRIALESGMAKVTFECGAEIVLQGPCDFVLQSKMAGYLNSGRITANVPRRAFSFAILSPEVDLIDMGTAFGVNVGADGQTELHVFEGEVLCGPSKDDARERKGILHVAANRALEFRSKQSDPSDILMNEEQFASHIALRQTIGVLPTNIVSNRLALWLSADMGVTTDPEQRVISWQDILFGENSSAEDAVQTSHKARPRLVPEALNGKPAIRFDGISDYLLTTPLETTDDQTVLFVCQFSETALDQKRIWGGQILNYDGPPSRYLSNTLEPGVLQIGEPLLEGEFKPTLLTGQVFAGFIGAATVEAGRVDAKEVGVNVPVVVSYVYDYGNGRAVLSINGRPCGEERAFAPQEITSRKIIGRHAWMELFFHGDLAELMIYNKALSQDELRTATAYLSGKYAIQLDPVGDIEEPGDDSAL